MIDEKYKTLYSRDVRTCMVEMYDHFRNNRSTFCVEIKQIILAQE